MSAHLHSSPLLALQYSPSTHAVDSFAEAVDRISFVAAYSRAIAIADVAQQRASLGGVSKPVWMTEFGYGLDGHGGDPRRPCILPTMVNGGVHGAFHAARILAAINMPGSFEALAFETFVWPVS